ncbi:hypothetical protein ACJX0J_036172 [Zea mays]
MEKSIHSTRSIQFPKINKDRQLSKVVFSVVVAVAAVSVVIHRSIYIQIQLYTIVVLGSSPVFEQHIIVIFSCYIKYIHILPKFLFFSNQIVFHITFILAAIPN